MGYQDHLKYDFSCWRIRKQEERKMGRSKNKRRKGSGSRYEYESDSGRGTSSDSSCHEEDVTNPSIRTALEEGQEQQAEVIIVSQHMQNKNKNNKQLTVK